MKSERIIASVRTNQSPTDDGVFLDRFEHRLIEDKPQNADHDHAQNNGLGLIPLHGIKGHISKARGPRDQLGANERSPPESN